MVADKQEDIDGEEGAARRFAGCDFNESSFSLTHDPVSGISLGEVHGGPTPCESRQIRPDAGRALQSSRMPPRDAFVRYSATFFPK
jgi:hypothetical protein